jgi:hypothetical protein
MSFNEKEYRRISYYVTHVLNMTLFTSVRSVRRAWSKTTSQTSVIVGLAVSDVPGARGAREYRTAHLIILDASRKAPPVIYGYGASCCTCNVYFQSI